MADFSGKTLALRTGRGETDVEIFVAVLAHSNLIYAEATADQTVRHWTMARVARASLFTAQAIALDMIAAGRKKQVDQVLDYVATIVPGTAPEPLGSSRAYSLALQTNASGARPHRSPEVKRLRWGRAAECQC